MRRVVPSEVLKFIDATMPGAPKQAADKTTLEFGASYKGILHGLVKMIDEIPRHLITMQGSAYFEYLAALETIRSTVLEWQGTTSSATLKKVPGISEGLNPVTIVRRALQTCPDDLPSPESQQLAFISDAAFRSTLQSDIATVERALGDGEWKTATVLAGSVIEAVLLWALEQKDTKSPGAPLARANALKLSMRGPTLPEWELHPYVEVAADLKIIDQTTKTAAGLAKNYRNLIHPGRAVRLQQQCDRGTAYGSAGALDHVVRDVQKWNAAGQP